MSLVSTFVQATDNKFYQNPVIYGDDWYLCFDDDDLPEVVIKTTVKRTAQKLAGERLKKAGVKYKWMGANVCGSRLFPPSYTGFHKAFSFFLELLEPLPLPQDEAFAIKFDTVVDYPSSECTFHAFSLEFDVENVAKLFTGQDPSPFLLNFLGVWKKANLEQNRKGLQKGFIKQYPEFRGQIITEDVLRARFGERVRINRYKDFLLRY